MTRYASASRVQDRYRVCQNRSNFVHIGSWASGWDSVARKKLHFRRNHLVWHHSATTNFIFNVFERNSPFRVSKWANMFVLPTQDHRSLPLFTLGFLELWHSVLRRWWCTFMHENVHIRPWLTFVKLVVAELYAAILAARETSEQDQKVWLICSLNSQ